MRTVTSRRVIRDRAKRELADQQLLCPSFDADWTNGNPWRMLRIMGEFVDGFEFLVDIGKKAATVFDSARVQPGSGFYQLGEEAGKVFAEAGYAVITDGEPGLMEAASKGTHENGRFSVDLGIELSHEQGMNQYVDSGAGFQYFFMRKTMFMKYVQTFAVLPDGSGILDEFFKAIILVQTRKIKRFPIVLVGEDYWSGLLGWVRNGLVVRNVVDLEEIGITQVVDIVAEI